ncbi:AgmX/PglI C-terminal domain-containing protein [Leptospira mtsangambouensis]|uniref:AgmX/PglI C-terminal domain-containing protein n=1 Tax=Leptospira mtsangambouensis TaxID=2484912 RepID=UPI001EEA836F|nr:AgmX/PglI C-terminal domain-containing protein [Leptospira mtsangambouensis]MCG6142592.1 AgmX/PglI C-terminal domain-containing protein [Leptospira mtsangambouensis]
MKKQIPYQKEIILVTLTTLILSIVYFFFLRPNGNGNQFTKTSMEVDKKGLSPYHKREVNFTITKHKRKIQICYNLYLETKPKIEEGKIQFDWQIDLDGIPTKVELIQSDLPSDSLINCIQKEISSWEFPPPPERSHNTYAEYTFFFKKEVNLPK